MDLRKLEAFLTVANTGKYTDAADKLFISQSSLSKQMAQMERELGVKLFKKTRNGVELTQAGFDFYSYVRKMLPEYHRAVDRLQMYREGGTYPLRIGSLPLAEEYGFANAFSSYWARNTSVQIDYFERSQEDLIYALQRNKLDLAIVRLDMLDHSQFSTRKILTDELVVVFNKHNPLAHRKSIDLESLRNEQFILPTERSDLSQVFINACKEHGIYPDAPLTHSRHWMLLKAVQRNMGTTVMPRGMATPLLA